MKEAIEFGPYPVNSQESDALCKVVARSVSGCDDAIAVLDEVLAARGIFLTEGGDGQWGWSGIRVRPDIIGRATVLGAVPASAQDLPLISGSECV